MWWNIPWTHGVCSLLRWKSSMRVFEKQWAGPQPIWENASIEVQLTARFGKDFYVSFIWYLLDIYCIEHVLTWCMLSSSLEMVVQVWSGLVKKRIIPVEVCVEFEGLQANAIHPAGFDANHMIYIQGQIINASTMITITYWVFYHNLLITKLHYIECKKILMAYIHQMVCFIATRKSNFLNERWGGNNNEPYLKSTYHVTQK